LENVAEQHKNCQHCDSQIALTSSFCSVCGKLQNASDLEHLDQRKQHLKYIGFFLAVELLMCILAYAVDSSITSILFFDGIFAVSAVVFFILLGSDGIQLLKWPRFSILKLLGAIVFAVAFSYGVNQIIPWINTNIFNTAETSYSLQYIEHPYSKYIMVVSIALMPAIFEELAYRGYLMEKFLKIMGKRETVYLSSFLFFLMHFSIASIFWMIPFAIVLAEIRLRENTLWYGIIIHFCFNFTTCLIDIYNFYDEFWFPFL